MKKKNKMRGKKILLAVLIVLLVLAIGLAVTLSSSVKDVIFPQEPGKQGVENIAKEMVLSVIEDTAASIKAELELTVKDILEENTDSARTRVNKISKDISGLRKPLEQAVSLLKKASPSKAKKLEAAGALLDTALKALDEIMHPLIDFVEENPITQLKVGDGFNTRLIGRYLDFAESMIPRIEETLESINAVDLKFMEDELGEYLSYLDKANEILGIFRDDPELIPMLKAMLGTEENRLYVVAVQNPAEIRASGGFPGSVGTMRIEDGVLTMGDFQSVTYMLSAATPKDIKITQEERALYYHLSGIQTPRDADLCPDFERVGHIWALAYEHKRKETVDGVISVTPHVVQRLLKAMDEEIELFDGTVMNGDNALEVLLHDIYFKYFSTDYTSGRYETTDDLFAEAAKITMEKLTNNISTAQLLQYIPVARDSVKDRTLMVWMKDEQEQAFIQRIGWSGGLNKDPEKPEAGVYYNCILSSKMGWYVLMDTQIGDRVKNEDGSYTYPVTVTFANNATKEELKTAIKYITGGQGGNITSAAFFFAPAGGTVGDFVASNGQKIQIKTYNGYDLGFMDRFALKPDTPIVITYNVTTAPGVETPLTFSKTPTAQDYHEFYGVG